MQYKYVQKRIIYRLLILVRRFGQKQPDGTLLIAAPLSQQLITNSINTSRENVSRELEPLRKKGYLRHEPKQIIVLDPVGLEAQFPWSTDILYRDINSISVA